MIHQLSAVHFIAKETGQDGSIGKGTQLHDTASFILTLPGKILDISALNSQHKFRDRGKKQGAVDAIEHLEEAGLGIVHRERATRGTALVSITIGANCPGTSGTVPDLELSSRVPHGTCFLCEMSRKFYSPELSNNYNLPVMLVYGTRSLWALNNALLACGWS